MHPINVLLEIPHILKDVPQDVRLELVQVYGVPAIRVHIFEVYFNILVVEVDAQLGKQPCKLITLDALGVVSVAP